MRACTRCNVIKDLGDFYKNSRNKSGIDCWCKSCHSIANKKYCLENRDRVNTRKRLYVLKNKTRISAQRKEFRKNNSESIAGQKLQWSYGISILEYNHFLSLQNHCCCICNMHQSTLSQRLAVDHDHKTGKIRGLLCGKCNKGIGLFKDSIELMRKAINYLDKKQEGESRNVSA